MEIITLLLLAFGLSFDTFAVSVSSGLAIREINFLKAQDGIDKLKDIVTDVMRCKLLRRTRKQKGNLSLKDLENIEKISI